MQQQYDEMFDNPIIKDIIHLENNGSQLLQSLNSNLPYSLIRNRRVANNNLVSISLSVPGYHYEDSLIADDSIMLPQHQHNAFECMMVLSGTVIHHVGSHTFHYSKGHCCLLNRNITHIEEYSDEYDVVFCILKKEFIQQIINQKGIFTEDKLRKESLITQLVNEDYEDISSIGKAYIDYVPIQDEPATNKLQVLLQELYHETIAPGPGSTFIIQGLFSRLLSCLDDKNNFCSSRVNYNSSQQEYLFMKIRLIIEAHHGCITRSELEELLHYNGEYLNRIVHKFTGNNITHLCQTYLLTEFNMRLMKSDENIESILKDFNISNHSHFYKLYKSVYGMTPQNYRKS